MVTFLKVPISKFASTTTALAAATVPLVMPSNFSKSVSFISAEPIMKEPPDVTLPVDVIAPEPTVPARVTLAPLNVAAVVDPLLTRRLLLELVSVPY